MSIGTFSPQVGHADQSGTMRPVRRRPWAHAALAVSMVAGLGATSFMTLSPAGAATRQAQTAPAFLQAFTVSGYGKVLVDAKHLSLYGLTSDSPGKLACSGPCLKFWPPALVSSSATSVSVGAGVSGKIGFVKRSAATKQVTFNGYPLYLFIKDKGPGQSNGAGVKAFGGTWGLVRASATTKAASLVLHKSSTTATTKGSGGGY